MWRPFGGNPRNGASLALFAGVFVLGAMAVANLLVGSHAGWVVLGGSVSGAAACLFVHAVMVGDYKGVRK